VNPKSIWQLGVMIIMISPNPLAEKNQPCQLNYPLMCRPQIVKYSDQLISNPAWDGIARGAQKKHDPKMAYTPK